MRPGRTDFPTAVRALGVALMLYAALIDRGRNPELIPAATAMVFFKTVVNGRA